MIHVTIDRTKKQAEPKYPMLMEAPEFGEIILATGETQDGISGTVLNHVAGRPSCTSVPGRHRKDWDKKYFRPFKGSITLNNDIGPTLVMTEHFTYEI